MYPRAHIQLFLHYKFAWSNIVALPDTQFDLGVLLGFSLQQQHGINDKLCIKYIIFTVLYIMFSVSFGTENTYMLNKHCMLIH